MKSYQFLHIERAAIILFTVPMAAIGVVPALIVTGVNISIFAIIGMIMLVGTH